MPWRGPNYDGEFPSLGWEVSDWVTAYLRVPDGPFAGESLELTDEQLALLVRWYGVDDRGRWLFRRGCKRAPQGWGKSPFLGAVGLAELAGPSRFGGWDADGDPVAVRPVAPWVQVAAVSEDQTDNTFAAAYAMAQDSELAGSTIDVGLTRMFLVGEVGRLEPVTASAGSRLGQRISFAVLDETHLWTRRNGGVKLAATIRRNAAKMGGRTFESTNAHLVGEDSVAERTHEAAQMGADGLLYEAFEAPPVEDLTDSVAVRAALPAAYRDSTKWVPVERIVADMADPGTDPDDARRFFMNQLTSGGDCPFDMLVFDELARPNLEVPPDALVGLGFDGSISNDRTVLWGCWLRDDEPPHLFKVARWAPDLGERVDRAAVKRTVRETFDGGWRVGRMFADPPKWWTEIDEWADDWGEETVLALDTNQARRFAPECDRFVTALREQAFTHDGDPELRQSLAACARRQVRLADDTDDGRSKFVVVKADARKIDDAVAAILSYGAAMTMPAQPANRYTGPLVAFR